jgi:hypothetical protein
MRREQNGLARLGTVKASDDIIYCRAGSIFIAGKSGLHFRGVAER